MVKNKISNSSRRTDNYERRKWLLQRNYTRENVHNNNANNIKNNTDTINRIKQLPLQDTNDPFAYQLFYGSSFCYITDKL